MNLRKPMQRGMALIESLLAVLILALGVLGAIGLQGKSAAALADTSMRAEATIASEQLLGMMWSDQTNIANYNFAAGTPGAALAQWVADTEAAIPGATGISVVTALEPGSTNRYKTVITISWKRRQSDSPSNYTVTAYLEPSR